MLGDFTLKERKMRRKICVYLKIDRIETEFAVRKIIAVSKICVIEVLDSNVKATIVKISFLEKLPHVLHTQNLSHMQQQQKCLYPIIKFMVVIYKHFIHFCQL